MEKQPIENNPKKKSAKQFSKFTGSAKGGDLLLLLVCIGIASVFWLFLSLYEEIERDYDLPIKIENVPDSIVIVENTPATVNVVAQGKGVQFLKFLWRDLPPLKINFKEFAGSSGVLNVSRQKFEALLRDYFGQGVKILSLRPETIKAQYTSNVGRKVELEIDCDIQPSFQCVISGPIVANVDSVMLYSANDLPRELTSVATYPLIRSGLKDTTEYVVKIKPIEGVRVIPDQVKITVPVEPLIAKRRTLYIDVINQPEDIKLVTFPSTVEVNYLLPMSAYNNEAPIKLFVDYNTINRETQKVKVQTTNLSGLYRNFTFKPDSVEYIIESRNDAQQHE